MPRAETAPAGALALAARNRRGIVYMIAAMAVFAAQDGMSRHLAEASNPVFVVALRYWALALFVIILAGRRHGGIRAVARSRRPWLQVGRGVLLAVEVIVAVWAFTLLGLAEVHAIFAVYPLMVVALSVPVLGEHVGWRRAAAVVVGFIGVLIILRPGLRVLDPAAFVAFGAAFLFAIYGLLTRFVARDDSAATSFFWTGIAGAAFMTAIVPFFWSGFAGWDWALMAVLCVTGAGGHFLLIMALASAEAAVIQPFAYVQLVLASAVGVMVFDDPMALATVIGAAVITLAGMYAFWREARQGARQGGHQKVGQGGDQGRRSGGGQ
ncbi:MAG: DMT family transporter [Pseudomonadota bacterium]